MSQKETAERLGFKQAYISRFEKSLPERIKKEIDTKLIYNKCHLEAINNDYYITFYKSAFKDKKEKEIIELLNEEAKKANLKYCIIEENSENSISIRILAEDNAMLFFVYLFDVIE